MKHYKIRIEGKVQGVFFRASTKAEADRLLLKGFVKNKSDGSVYLEAEGTKEMLDELIKWCQTGPAHAEVSKIEIEEGTPALYSSFEIRR